MSFVCHLITGHETDEAQISRSPQSPGGFRPEAWFRRPEDGSPTEGGACVTGAVDSLPEGAVHQVYAAFPGGGGGGMV